MNACTALVPVRKSPANGLAPLRQVLRQSSIDAAIACPSILPQFQLEPLEARRLLSGGFGDHGWTHAQVPGFDAGTIAEPTVITAGQGGKVYVGGEVWGNIGQMFVTRFNPDGSPDGGFASDGSGTVSIPCDFDTCVDHVMELSSGKILVTGESTAGMAVVMLNADGSVDSDFGGGLRVYDVMGRFPYGAVTYNDNVTLTSSGEVKLTAMNHGNLVTLMLTGNGHPDLSFAPNGYVTSAVDAGGESMDALIGASPAADGGLVGYADIWVDPPPIDEGGGVLNIVSVDRSAEQHLVRVTIDANGNVTSQTPVETGLTASMTIDGDYAYDFIADFNADGSAYVSTQGTENRIAKLTPDGQLDSSFGDHGLVTLPYRYATGFTATPDGGLLVEAGRYDTSFFGAEDVTVKLTANGSIDPNFNEGQPAGMGAIPATQFGDGTVYFAYPGGGYHHGVAIAPNIVLEKMSTDDVEVQETNDPAAWAAIQRGHDAASTPANGMFVDELYGVAWDPDGEPTVLDAGA